MSELVRVINNEDQFHTELQNAGSKLVIADFSAKWCGPCQRIAPYFKLLSHQYVKAVFLKVDVDQCQDMAVNESISAMPTFVFYRNKSAVDRLQGADPMALENKIQKYYNLEQKSEDRHSNVSSNVTEKVAKSKSSKDTSGESNVPDKKITSKSSKSSKEGESNVAEKKSSPIKEKRSSEGPSVTEKKSKTNKEAKVTEQAVKSLENDMTTNNENTDQKVSPVEKKTSKIDKSKKQNSSKARKV